MTDVYSLSDAGPKAKTSKRAANRPPRAQPRVKLKLNWLFNVTINDISVIHVTAHRCAGGLKKKLDLRSGSHTIDIS